MTPSVIALFAHSIALGPATLLTAEFETLLIAHN